MNTATPKPKKLSVAADSLTGRDAPIFDLAPQIAAFASFLFGALALIAAVNPHHPHIPGLSRLSDVLDEWPEFTVSIAGVALMSLAFGLRRRLDTAWAAAVALLAFLGAYALIRHEHLPSGAICLTGCVLLAASRRAFYRHAGLSALLPSRALYLAIAAALTLAGIGAILFAATRPGFAAAPWWTLITDIHIGQAGRAAAVGALMLAGMLVWSFLLAPARRSPPAPAPGEIAKVEQILAGADLPYPEAQLAFLGDKSFVFSDDDQAFVMAARAGASFVAMGGPVGKRGAWRKALAAFRSRAEVLGLRPVIYAAPPELLPDLLDLGYRMEKVGENAIIDLRSFSLVGSRRQALRTARRKLAEREGATFEVIAPPAPAPFFEVLRSVSDAWLEHQKGGEKSFSLGRFDAGFLAHSHLAVMKVHNKPAAFLSLWTTPDGRAAAIDLMRYDPALTPNGAMDFLITETILWAQEQKFLTFDLGMAPLSGLSEERHAPLFARLGRLIYDQGGAFYNFDGLRRFKEKFTPDWEPRYLAAPGTWSLPIVLAEIAIMTSRP